MMKWMNSTQQPRTCNDHFGGYHQLWRVILVSSCLFMSSCDQVGNPTVDLRIVTTIPGASTLPSSIAVKRTGELAVASATGAPEYAIQYVEIGQSPEIVGVAGNVEHLEVALSLAFTHDNRPMIAYTDDRTGDLVFAERTASGWATQIVDATGQVGYFPSLAVDCADRPHISYFDNTLNDIKYAHLSSTGWRIETIDAEGLPGFHIPAGFTQIALRPEPDQCLAVQPQVAYLAYRYKPYDGELRFATRHHDGWRIETVDSTTGAGGFPALTLDPAGNPWISYYRAGTWDYHSGELKVAHRSEGQWRAHTVDRDGNAGRFSSIAVSAHSMPVVAYYAAKTGDLRVAWWWNGRWRTQMLVSDGNAGAWVQLAIDSQSLAHLTYVDAGVMTTQYAVFLAP
jgi:hypothetical protein